MTPEPLQSERCDTPAPRRGSWVRRYLSVPTLIVLAIIAYLAFFGENSISQRIVYQRAIDSLSQCLAAQQDSLEYYRDLNRRLSHDPALMEQVVREQYNMNRPDEDVYIVERQAER